MVAKTEFSGIKDERIVGSVAGIWEAGREFCGESGVEVDGEA